MERKLKKADTLKYFKDLNEILKKDKIRAEANIYDGAVMCLVLNARSATHDIDGIFRPTQDVRKAIKKVAENNNLENDWFNDGIKGFLSSSEEMKKTLTFSNLTIFTATPEYLLAMKCLASRIDSENDINDIQFLLKHLKIKTVDQAFTIIEKFYPRKRILPKTQFLLEELLQ